MSIPTPREHPQLSTVDLNLLVAFDALVSERSVTRAAERLSVGQSAMSATLNRLRRLFGDPLLVRQGRVLTATPFAESLAEPVHEALSIIERVLAAKSHFDPATDRRTFTVMASDYVALVLLRPLLVDLALDAPNVRLHVCPLTTDFDDQLRRSQIDLLILPDELLGSAPHHPTATVFTDRYLCAVARDNPDVGDELSADQFSSQPYLAYQVGAIDSLAERQLEAAGIVRNVEITTEAFALAPHLLPGTRLLTLILERHAELVAEQLELRLLQPPIDLRPVNEVMMWARRNEHDAGHAWLRERLIGVGAAL